jgi:hypothetical protein
MSAGATREGLLYGECGQMTSNNTFERTVNERGSRNPRWSSAQLRR